MLYWWLYDPTSLPIRRDGAEALSIGEKHRDRYTDSPTCILYHIIRIYTCVMDVGIAPLTVAAQVTESSCSALLSLQQCFIERLRYYVLRWLLRQSESSTVVPSVTLPQPCESPTEPNRRSESRQEAGASNAAHPSRWADPINNE